MDKEIWGNQLSSTQINSNPSFNLMEDNHKELAIAQVFLITQIIKIKPTILLKVITL